MTVIYQAYGRADIIRQTVFSIVSLLKVLPPTSSIKIGIYTDDKVFLEKFFSADPRVDLISITPEQIERWRGAIQFVHRVKVEVLLEATRRYPGPLIYCDGDTYFQMDPTPYFQQINEVTSLMHVAESKISEGRDPLSKKIARFLNKERFDLHGKEIKISPDTVMWNAGVIGLSKKLCQSLPDVLSLTDQMHSRYPKHVMEQLAFSYVLQTQTKVLATDSLIGHYWDQKEEYQVRIDDFLNRWPKLPVALANYTSFIKPAPKSREPKKTFWSQWLPNWL